MRLDVNGLLGHLQAVRAAPKDGRSFVAMERRPDMIAAGVPVEHIDGFDFDDEPRLDALIVELGNWRLDDNFGYLTSPRNADETVTVTAYAGRQPASAAPPTGRGGGLLYPRPTSDRANIISGKGKGQIDVAPNLNANGKAPLLEWANSSMVGANENYIPEIAAKHGIDPDLLRATIFMESTHGYYDAGLRRFDADKSILPMNINTNYWSDTWGLRPDLRDSRKNIEAGATMLENIHAAIPKPTVAQIASVYNNGEAKKVSDYGARVQSIYEKRPWLKSKMLRP